MPNQPVASQTQIFINGSEIQETIIQKVLEIVVDQHAQLPGMVTIRLEDSDFAIMDSGPFDLTKEVEIKAVDGRGTIQSLFKGEVTALEPRFDEGRTAELLVRGYHKSHRLLRDLKSRTFLNQKDSDIANMMAGEAGLSPQVDATSISYKYLAQHNQSNLAFLMQRAWRIGYECFVDDGKLYFRKPPESGPEVTLKWGEDLLSFFPRMTLAEQVDSTEVRGWDPDKQQGIVGQSSSGKLFPKIGEAKDGKVWASAFGSAKYVVVDHPVIDQSEANLIAQARLNEISGGFIEAEGTAFRRPDIKAGSYVKLEQLSQRFNGKYLVTNAQHVMSPEGLKTTFMVRGIRTGTLMENLSHGAPTERWYGVVPGLVTNTNDPDKKGRIKVAFPWLGNEFESHWARLVAPGAGKNAGFAAVPEVNDEVMVMFEHGDFNFPVVLGGVWSSKNTEPEETAGASSNERPLVRTWRSIKGHRLVMYDDSNKRVELITTDGHKIVLDDKNKTVEIKTSGGHTVSMDDQGQKVTAKHSGGTSSVTLETAKVAVAGTQIEIKGSASVKIEAGMIDVAASGILNLKGATVKIN
ncbi:MAG: VgrG-related protein [Anaerolineae bacterium]|nr:VgrG-related protein [Anaerolineae bacterium]